MKAISIVSLVFLLACTSSEVEDLFDKNSPSYGYLKEKAATKCLSESAIFTNLRKDSFIDGYGNSWAEGDVFELSADSGETTKKYYIKVDSVEAGTTVFSLLTDTSGSVFPFLRPAQYSVSIDQHTKIVDMIGKAICADTFIGSPDASDTQLNAQVNRYYIQDDNTDVNDPDDLPEIFNLRTDQFVLQEDLPAFMFLWTGKYTRSQRKEGETSAQVIGPNLTLTAKKILASDCEAGVDCLSDNPIGSATPLIVNENEPSLTRSKSADAVDKYYFTNF